MNQLALNSPQILHLLSALLFSLGILCLIVRRNSLVLLMGVELMLNAVNLSFVTYSREIGSLTGQLQVFFIITLAACESAVGLAILVHIYRHFGTLRTDAINQLRG
jgi:NADH-quinone oxidoreductase subunit K